MEVRKAIKKVVALAAGASMVGATILGASAAADLANYPAPFIQDGVFNGILVVGDKAKAEDVIGVTDIAMSMQYAARTASTTTESTVTSVQGDTWLVGSSGNKLELADGSGGMTVCSTTMNYEAFDCATTRVSGSELKALANGKTQTSKGSAPYEQYIRLEDGQVMFQEDTDTDVVADYVKYANTNRIMNYSLEFTTSWESDIDDSSGNALATGLYLTDFEDEEITIAGATFTVLQARRYAAANTNGIKLTLLGGELHDSLEEGETKTYTVGGKEYTIENVIVTDSGTQYTQFRINGELTSKMQEDQTKTLSDGTIFAVADILANEAGDITGDIVKFYAGAQKLELWDSDITNSAANNQKITINDESVSSSIAEVWIKGTNPSNTSMKIDKIALNILADDNVWVPAGKKLTENAELDADAVALLNALHLDVYYAGLTAEDTNKIQLSTSGDDKYELSFVNTQGNTIKIPLAYDNDTATTGGLLNARFGDQSNILWIGSGTTPPASVAKDEYFIVSSDSTLSTSTVSEVFQYKGADRVWDTSGTLESSPELKIKALGSGETSTRSLTTSSGQAQTTFTLGGREYTIQNTSSASSNDWHMNITSGTGTFDSVVTQNGQQIKIYPNDSSLLAYRELAGGFAVTLVDPTNAMDSDVQPMPVNYTITATPTDQKIVATVATGSLTVTTTDYDNNVKEGMNSYGLHVKDTKDSTNPRVLEITVPKKQRVAQVYLTGGETTTTTKTSSGAAATEVVKIDVGAAQLASAVAGREKSENLILVGGPCANAAAAVIVGKPFVAGVAPDNCADGYVAGKAVIQLFENDGKVAMLVAGDQPADTRAAAKVVASYDKHADVFKGTKLEVTETSSASPKVAAAPVESGSETAT